MISKSTKAKRRAFTAHYARVFARELTDTTDTGGAAYDQAHRAALYWSIQCFGQKGRNGLSFS